LPELQSSIRILSAISEGRKVSEGCDEEVRERA
jgi:hypothetical protein